MKPPRMLNERAESRAPYIVAAVIAVLLMAVLVLNILRTRYTFTVAVSGTSMEDTVFDGDIVYALRNAEAKRGDIVIIDVADDPVFSTGGRHTENIIKRLIAVEGDSVKCEGGVVSVKPAGGAYAPLEEPYTKGETRDFPETELGEGEMFFLGDNRAVSHDSSSADVGALPVSRIIGVVPDWAVSIKSFTTGWENFRLSLQKLFS